MKLKILVPMLFASLAASAPISHADPLFDRLDQNKDGKLTKDEVPEQVLRQWERLDQNTDGVISLEEHETYRASRDRPARPTPQAMFELKRDIAYADTDNPRQQLDLMLPKLRKAEKLPVIVFIHGGAWRAGNKSAGLGRLMPFVSSGEYAGISVGYRLTGEAIWPAQIHDCKAAIRWIRANAETYGLDPDRIGVWGSSAGGHLVCMLGTSGGVKELEGELGSHPETSSRVQCVVNFFGPTHLNTMGDFDSTMNHNAPDSPESVLIGGAIPDHPEKALAASPIHYVTEDDPPFLHVHGTKDPLVPFPQAEELHAALEKVKVPSTLHPVEGAGHGFKDLKADEQVRAFLKKYLQPES